MKKRYQTQNAVDTRDAFIMLAPFLLLFVFFIVAPVVISIVLGFTYFDMIQLPSFVGLDNYIQLFLNDDGFIKALSNTMVFACITGPICYLISFIVAWMISFQKRALRTLITFLFYAPSISGNMYVIWSYIFSGDSYGVINAILMQFGFISTPIQWLTDADYILSVIIVVQIWMSLGTGFLSFIAGLQNIDKTMYEAGEIDGIKNRWQQLFYITMPSMGPQLQFGAVMQIASSFSVGSIAVALVGFPSTDDAANTIVTHIMDYGNLRYELGYACAISTVLFIIMMAANALITKLLKIVTKE